MSYCSGVTTAPREVTIELMVSSHCDFVRRVAVTRSMG